MANINSREFRHGRSWFCDFLGGLLLALLLAAWVVVWYPTVGVSALLRDDLIGYSTYVIILETIIAILAVFGIWKPGCFGTYVKDNYEKIWFWYKVVLFGLCHLFLLIGTIIYARNEGWRRFIIGSTAYLPLVLIVIILLPSCGKSEYLRTIVQHYETLLTTLILITLIVGATTEGKCEPMTIAAVTWSGGVTVATIAKCIFCIVHNNNPEKRRKQESEEGTSEEKENITDATMMTTVYNEK